MSLFESLFEPKSNSIALCVPTSTVTLLLNIFDAFDSYVVLLSESVILKNDSVLSMININLALLPASSVRVKI